MKLLPPPGPERKRLIYLLGALVVAAVAYWGLGLGTPTSPAPTTAGGPRASNPLGGSPPPTQGSAPTQPPAATTAAPRQPEPLKLAQIEEVPDEPAAGRNLFRFGVPPPPRVEAPPPPPLPPPMPTGPPPIPLRLTGLMADPYGKTRAYLKDPTGAVFEAVEGQVVDGRYRLLKVGTSSVVLSYLDGTGQRTVTLGG